MNVFNRRGGVSVATNKIRPNEAETLGLSVAMALRMCKVQAGPCDSINFRGMVAAEAKRLRVTSQLWTGAQLYNDVFDVVYNHIPSEKMTSYLSKAFKVELKGLREEQRSDKKKELTEQFVLNTIFMCIAFRGGASTIEELEELAAEARLQEVLTEERIFGGYSDWTVDRFVNADVWEHHGDECGIQTAVAVALRDIACVVNDVDFDEWDKYEYVRVRCVIPSIHATAAEAHA